MRARSGDRITAVAKSAAKKISALSFFSVFSVSLGMCIGWVAGCRLLWFLREWSEFRIPTLQPLRQSNPQPDHPEDKHQRRDCSQQNCPKNSPMLPPHQTCFGKKNPCRTKQRPKAAPQSQHNTDRGHTLRNPDPNFLRPGSHTSQRKQKGRHHRQRPRLSSHTLQMDGRHLGNVFVHRIHDFQSIRLPAAIKTFWGGGNYGASPRAIQAAKRAPAWRRRTGLRPPIFIV